MTSNDKQLFSTLMQSIRLFQININNNAYVNSLNFIAKGFFKLQLSYLGIALEESYKQYDSNASSSKQALNNKIELHIRNLLALAVFLFAKQHENITPIYDEIINTLIDCDFLNDDLATDFIGKLNSKEKQIFDTVMSKRNAHKKRVTEQRRDEEKKTFFIKTLPAITQYQDGLSNVIKLIQNLNGRLRKELTQYEVPYPLAVYADTVSSIKSQIKQLTDAITSLHTLKRKVGSSYSDDNYRQLISTPSDQDHYETLANIYALITEAESESSDLAAQHISAAMKALPPSQSMPLILLDQLSPFIGMRKITAPVTSALTSPEFKVPANELLEFCRTSAPTQADIDFASNMMPRSTSPTSSLTELDEYVAIMPHLEPIASDDPMEMEIAETATTTRVIAYTNPNRLRNLTPAASTSPSSVLFPSGPTASVERQQVLEREAPSYP